MRVLISADVEGMTAVTCPDDCVPGTPQFTRLRPILTGDVNAVAVGFLDAGVDDVLVCDAHGPGRNFLLELLDPRVRMTVGTHKTYSMMEGIQSRPELVAFVGYHAAAGAEGVLSHTMIGPPLIRAELNGQVMSEGLLNAALAAEFGARVALVSGDDRTCEDAERYAPGAERVVVKQAIDRYTATCLHPRLTAERLREAATRAGRAGAGAAGAGGTTGPDGPLVCDMEFSTSNVAAACALVPTVERLGERTVRLRADSASSLYGCVKTVCRVARTSTERIYG